MKVRDVAAALERLAPLGWAYSWDRPGLRIGDPEAKVTRVLVALTATREVFNRARDARAELVVLHHPPLWRPLETLRTDDPDTRLFLDFAQAGIACYASHTNLDVAPGGLNHLLAAKLGLTGLQPLIPAEHAAQVKLVTFVPEDHLAAVRAAVCEAGAGVIGEYTHCSFSAPGTGTFLPGEAADPFSGEKGRVNEEPERRFEVLVDKARLPEVIRALFDAHPYEEPAYDVVSLENRNRAVGLGVRGETPAPTTLDAFARHVREALGLAYVQCVGPPDRRVRTAGVIGGAGGSEFRRVPPGVDVLVTGDVRYHDAVDAAERGLALIDAGHGGTERFIVSALSEYLAANLPALDISSYLEPDVFRLVQ